MLRQTRLNQPSSRSPGLAHQHPFNGKKEARMSRAPVPGMSSEQAVSHCACGGGCPRCSPPLTAQMKLGVSRPGDPYEQEADRVAEQVMRMPEPELQRACAPCAAGGSPCPKCAAKEEELVQRKTASLSSSENDSAQDDFLAGLSPGQPLDDATRGFMESRFGYDFSQVRLHTDDTAARSTEAVNALAYTVGKDVVFGAGQYQPSAAGFRKLLAHELTHVVQQGHAGSMRADTKAQSATGASSELVQRQPAKKPARENVWGFMVTRAMCGCHAKIRDSIAWAKTAGATYNACDTAANTTSTLVEACFDAAHPGSTPVATTSPSGEVTLPPASADPCQQIEDKASFVHETMHVRYTENLARSQGPAFYKEWQRLKGNPKRLDTMRATFPAQVTAFETKWRNGHEWAQDEVNSYRWEQRFLENALAALNRIC
jgi:Domain of unknown function (DUF4157)